ncbi:MAG: ATP-dependent zinc metalloprotease FtsH [bacterium]|nr:ATP-dependent zinc metalloprotease FtsH [bacterium]
MKNLLKNFAIFFFIFLVIAGIFSTYTGTRERIPQKDIGALMQEIKEGKVQSITIDGNQLSVTTTDGAHLNVRKEDNESLSTLLKNYNIDSKLLTPIRIEVKEVSSLSWWLGTLLPFIIPFLAIGLFLWIMMRQAQGMNNRAMMFGQSAAREVQKDDKNRTTFKSVAGAKEAKEELQEIVEFLKSPKKFAAVGAKIPKGVLLMGSPGTGKTLMARAVAGEANVPFFHISGSEFVEMFVGVGASRVRSLFQKAKKSAPCIIFMDEIDAVGRQRGAGLGGSHDEREQTLNQILVEMDGFDPNSGVIVIAATNRPDILDPALLRPGRFDRRVTLDLPDIKDREAILKIHAQNKPIDADVMLKRVAERTPGFSGADLANLMNEAAILAARRNKKTIGETELYESVEKVLLGPERKSHLLSEKERAITAYHEAGHATVAHFLPHADPVHKVSIISRGRAAGYTLKLPIEDKKMQSRAEFIDDIAVMVAGHIIEKEIFGDVTTGASNDLKNATQLARKLIMDYGMAESFPPRTFGSHEDMIFLGREISEQRDYSEKVAERIDAEIETLIRNGVTTAKRIITEERATVEKIVKVLLEKETIERDEFEKICGKKPPPVATAVGGVPKNAATGSRPEAGKARKLPVKPTQTGITTPATPPTNG